MLHLLQLMREGVFKKYDDKNPEKNKEMYGTEEPPAYDLNKIKDHNLTLVCGRGDLLVSPEDYTKLCEELQEAGNFINFMEFDVGHMGMVFPKDKSIVTNIVDKIVADYDEECFKNFSKDVNQPDFIVENFEDFGYEFVDKDGKISKDEDGQP